MMIINNWLQSTLTALFLYGLWGFLPKIAVTRIDPMSALVYEICGGMLVGIVALAFTGFRPQFQLAGVVAAFGTGISGILGTLFFFYALTRGKASVTVCLTALYPLISLVLAAFILHEPISIRHFFGMACALVAIVLLSG